MAAPVQQQFVARVQQALQDNLVGGGGTIGGKKCVLRPKGLCRQVLGFLDDALGLQQAVQYLYRDGQVCVKNVFAHKLVKIADPGAFFEAVAAGVTMYISA